MNDLMNRLSAQYDCSICSDAKARIEQLEAHVKSLLRYAPTCTVECRGDKCREPWCVSCNGEEAANDGLQQAIQIAEKARGDVK